MVTEAAYEVIVVGGGKGGKTLAIDLGHKGIRTALIERSPEMIGGSCINVACIPTKTLIASAPVARTARLFICPTVRGARRPVGEHCTGRRCDHMQQGH